MYVTIFHLDDAVNIFSILSAMIQGYLLNFQSIYWQMTFVDL